MYLSLRAASDTNKTMAKDTVIHHFIIMIIIINFHLISAETNRNMEKTLLTDLLTDYDKRVKPSGSLNGSLEVQFDLGIIQIIDVDERNQIFDAVYFVIQEWVDEELKWNPDHYGGVKSLIIPDDTIWMPNIEMHNHIDLILAKHSKKTTFLTVYSSGRVSNAYIIDYKSSCSMDLKYFPFDKQNCSLVFSSLLYRSELNLTSSLILSTDIYTESSQFKLPDDGLQAFRYTEKPCDTCSGKPIIHYHIAFKRRSRFYVFNLLIPCILVTIVAMLSFVIPPDSGEKVGLGVTVLLSMIVFLLIVTDQLPPTAELPLITVYYFLVILLVTLSTSLSVFTLSLHYNSVYKLAPPPSWAQKILLGRLARLLCVHTMPKEGATSKVCIHPHKESLKTEEKPKNLEEKATTQGSKDIRDILQLMQSFERRVVMKDMQENNASMWRQLAAVVDRLFLLTYALINLIITLCVYLGAATS